MLRVSHGQAGARGDDGGGSHGCGVGRACATARIAGRAGTTASRVVLGGRETALRRLRARSRYGREWSYLGSVDG
jgi:hypothetical protein